MSKMAVKEAKNRKRIGTEEVESTPPKRKRVDFCVSTFRKRLQKEGCYGALEEFVQLCRKAKDKNDPAAQFLREGGHLMEVLGVLDGGRGHDPVQVAVVFSALHALLLRVLAKVPEKRRSAEEMCHHLLNNHLNAIHSLLSTKSGARNKKAVLQLLTAVVTLGTVLARDVLSYVALTSEVVDNLVLMARPDDSQSVRTCFIQFLMAFLVEGSPSVIRLLLDKRKILTSIVPGLECDSSKLVVFVLTTLRTKLVEVMEIPKTQKLHTFNTRVMCGFLKLYKWKGPAGFVQKWKKDSKQADREILGNQQQQELVSEAVHDLLLALCTSYRHGVAFQDHTLGTSDTKQNMLVASVLKELPQPWEQKLQFDLVVRIVGTCPELVRIVYSKVAPVLKPRASPSWIKAVNFVTQVVASLKLSGLPSLEPNAALNAAKMLLAPINVLSPLAVPGLLHEHPAVRQKTAEYLQAVLHSVEVVQSALGVRQAAEFRRYILKLFPNGVVIEKACTLALTPSATEKNLITTISLPSPIQQMLTLVELIFLYQKHHPLLLYVGDAQNALAASLVKALDLKDSSDDNVLPLQVKVMQLLTLLDTSVLEPGKTGFSDAIDILLRASCKDVLSVEAQHALGALLVKCRVLEPAAADVTGELGIWLHSCRSVAPSHRPSIISFLQDVLNTVTVNPMAYVERVLKVQEITLHSVESRKLKNMVHSSLADQLFQELLGFVDVENSCTQGSLLKEENNKEKHNFDDLTSTVELSAMLMCVIEVVAEKNLEAPVEKYLSCVLVHLLHLQADPRPFLCVVGRWKSMPSTVAEYLNGWNGEQPVVLTKPFGSYTPESSLSRLLLEPNRPVPELEDCSNPISVVLLARLVTFHIAQLTERQLLTEQIIMASLNVFVALLHALQQATSSEDTSLANKYTVQFLNIILKHPLVLCYFLPLHKKKQVTEKLMTNLLLDFLGKAEILVTSSVKSATCVLLKEKLMRNIVHYLEKSKQTPMRTQTLLSAIKLLTLTGPEMHSLVPKLIRKMTVSPWTELLVHLLHNTSMLPFSVVTTLGRYLVEHLQKEDDENAEIWNVADAFQEYIQRFPHCVNHVPSSMFSVAASKKGVNLASVILQHQSSCVHHLTRLMEQKNSFVLVTPEVLFPLLATACHHGPLPSTLLKTVYKQYQGEILRAMETPFSNTVSFANHPEVVRQLIVECMDPHECRDLCRSLDENWKNLGLCTDFHLAVICGLQALAGWRKLAAALVHLLLHQLKQMLQQKVPSSLIVQTCSLLAEHLVDSRAKWGDQKMQPNEDWNMLPALILQTGLSGSDPVLTHNLFLALSRVLWRGKAIKMAEQVFEMTVSHSRFLDVMLAQERAGVKLAVLQLVLTCYQLAPHLMKPTHVPIWLGAYGATLSHTNQVILKILLSLQKNKDVNLNAYRPFLWGDAAVNHYSIRSRAGMSLWRIPQATVVLELLQSDMIENTISNFPVNRKLLMREQENSSQNENCISRYVEDLEPCQPEVYDPAFMVPLFSHIMAPESVVQDYKFSRLGGFALILRALGSECEFMRTAALSVLSRFHSHLDLNNPNARLHEQYIEAIRSGIGVLKSHVDRAKPEFEIKNEHNEATIDEISVTEGKASSGNISTSPLLLPPKVPNLSATFLARASLVLTHPFHTLYSPLHRFILAKPVLDLKTVPELLALLRPSTINFRVYQEWLLETARSGMRTAEDVDIAKGCHLFKMLFTLFSSSLSDSHIKILVLRLVESTSGVPTGTTTLVKCGVLPWLHATFIKLQEEEDSGLIIAFIRVAIRFKRQAPSLVTKVVPLLFKLPPAIETSDIHSVMQVALDSIGLISQDHLKVILHLCHGVLDHEVTKECYMQLDISEEIIDTLEVIEPSESSVRNELNTVERTALSGLLRTIVHKWLTHSDLPVEVEKYEHIPEED